MRILFIGCVESSYLLLNELINFGAEICGVVTKKNSQYNSDFRDLATLCTSNNVEYVFTQDARDSRTYEFIKAKKPDIIYCFGWSYLLKEDIIEIPKRGVVGFHPAKLPLNKGRHPIIWALVLGLQSTASTFFMIDEKADNGDIVSQVDVPISFQDDAKILYNKIMRVAKKQVIDITNSFIDGTINYIKQSSEEGNIWRKRHKEDGKIDFRMSSLSIYNLIRALTKPYIGAHINYEGKEYKIWSSVIIDDEHDLYNNIEAGKVIEVYDCKSFLVKTGDGLIKILESDDKDLRLGDYL